MNVTTSIIKYLNYINDNWHRVEDSINLYSIPEDMLIHDAFDNWLQFNWEIMVELAICDSGTFLVPYGGGADILSDSERVTHPYAKEVYEIICKPIQDKVYDAFTNEELFLKNYRFHRFVKRDIDTFTDYPPYNCIVLENLFIDEYCYITVKDIQFFRSLQP